MLGTVLRIGAWGVCGVVKRFRRRGVAFCWFNVEVRDRRWVAEVVGSFVDVSLLVFVLVVVDNDDNNGWNGCARKSPAAVLSSGAVAKNVAALAGVALPRAASDSKATHRVGLSSRARRYSIAASSLRDVLSQISPR